MPDAHKPEMYLPLQFSLSLFNYFYSVLNNLTPSYVNRKVDSVSMKTNKHENTVKK